MKYLILLSIRFLLKRKSSMLTACGAISATIILIIFNTLVVGGITDGVSRDIQDVQTGDLYISHNKNLFLERTDNQIITYLMTNPHIIGASSRTFGSLDLNHTDGGKVYEMFNVPIIGVDPNRDIETSVLHTKIIQGEFIDKKGTIVLDLDTANRLKASVGSYITTKGINIDGESFTKRLLIVGIFKVYGPLGFSETAIIHHDDLKEILNIDKRFSHSIIIKVDSKSNVESVKKWIIKNYRNDDWLEVETVEEFARLILNAYSEGIEFAYTISYAGMIASSLGVITILMMMVNSKVREIGILRALGMTDKEIIMLFIIIGAIIGLVGAVIGAVGGILLTTYLSNYPFALFSGLIPVITVRLSAFPFPMFIGFIISIFASIYPAWLASRYQPEEAMRYV